MITIKHVLKDGRTVESIKGCVIKAAEHEEMYQAISRLKKGGETDEKHTCRTVPQKYQVSV